MKALAILLFLSHTYATNLIYWVNRYSAEMDIDRRIVYALIEAESMGHTVTSPKGAVGIMQVKVIAARQYYKTKAAEGKSWAAHWLPVPDVVLRLHLKQDEPNIRIGCWYLRYCLDTAGGNYIQALNLYNRGTMDGVSWEYINRIIMAVCK